MRSGDHEGMRRCADVGLGLRAAGWLRRTSLRHHHRSARRGGLSQWPICGRGACRRSLYLLRKYHFTIVKEGYETLQVDQDITTPWYEYAPIDFFSETCLPYTVIDRREFHYKLEPRKLPDQAQFLQQAQNLREKGLALGPGKLAAQTPPPGVKPRPVPIQRLR